MKLNNKGFAISIILYAMIILIIGVLYLLIQISSNRYNLLKNYKEDIVDTINGEGINTVSDDYKNSLFYNYLSSNNTFNSIDSNRYFYGSDPNNYLLLKTESDTNHLFRIIGIMDNKYIKVIDTESYLNFSIDNTNYYSSSLFNTLNNDYYNSILDKNFIEKRKTHVTEISLNNYPKAIKKKEDGSLKVEKCYINLPYASDFAYAADSSKHNNKLDSSYSTYNTNWMSNSYSYLLQGYIGNKVHATNISSLDLKSIGEIVRIYPSFYLKSNIKYSSGVGSSSNPYQITL